MQQKLLGLQIPYFFSIMTVQVHLYNTAFTGCPMVIQIRHISVILSAGILLFILNGFCAADTRIFSKTLIRGFERDTAAAEDQIMRNTLVISSSATSVTQLIDPMGIHHPDAMTIKTQAMIPLPESGSG